MFKLFARPGAGSMAIEAMLAECGAAYSIEVVPRDPGGSVDLRDGWESVRNLVGQEREMGAGEDHHVHSGRAIDHRLDRGNEVVDADGCARELCESWEKIHGHHRLVAYLSDLHTAGQDAMNGTR